MERSLFASGTPAVCSDASVRKQVQAGQAFSRRLASSCGHHKKITSAKKLAAARRSSRIQHSTLVRASTAVRNPPAQPSVADPATEGAIIDCVVVGGGISGLMTAQALAAEQPGVSFLVTEARDRVGGNITTCTNDEGYLWEEGPNSFQPSDAILKAAVDAGLDKELVLGDPKAPRFVFWNKELLPTPSGPDIATFKLLSIWGKIRAGLGAVGIKQPMPEEEESVETYVRRNLGDEVFERLIEPFCSGVYAGDPSKLSMKAAFGKVYALEKAGGSIVAGVIKQIQAKRANPPPPRDARLPPKPAGQTVGSFRNGLQSLPRAVAAKHADNIRVQWKLTSIQKGGDGVFSLTYDTPDGAKTVRARTVALTAPAYVCADLLQSQASKAAEALRKFDYPPVAAVSIAYPLSAIREDRKNTSGQLPGFGQLHPRSQGVTTLGTIYSSSLFPGRAPPGWQLLLNYIGGATNRGIVNQTTEQLVEQVDKDLRTMLVKPDAPQPKTIGVRVWPKAIPQFNVHHLDVLEEAKAEISKAGLEGVVLGGNFVAGVALGKCVEFAYGFASDIASQLEAKQAA